MRAYFTEGEPIGDPDDARAPRARGRPARGRGARRARRRPLRGRGPRGRAHGDGARDQRRAVLRRRSPDRRRGRAPARGARRAAAPRLGGAGARMKQVGFITQGHVRLRRAAARGPGRSRTPTPTRNDVEAEARVCPHCGEPPGEGVFCAACGRNLAVVDRLPTRAEWEIERRAQDDRPLADRCAEATAAFLAAMHAAGDPGTTKTAMSGARASAGQAGRGLGRPRRRSRRAPAAQALRVGPRPQRRGRLPPPRQRGPGLRDARLPRLRAHGRAGAVEMPVEARLIAELGAVLAANGLERIHRLVRYRLVRDGSEPRVRGAHRRRPARQQRGRGVREPAAGGGGRRRGRRGGGRGRRAGR